jgi:hypothetical protein
MRTVSSTWLVVSTVGTLRSSCQRGNWSPPELSDEAQELTGGTPELSDEAQELTGGTPALSDETQELT